MFKYIYSELHKKDNKLDSNQIALLSGHYLKPANPFKLLLIRYLMLVVKGFKSLEKLTTKNGKL